ncbi:MAG: RsiV family protein [Truepera sp.]|jgi:hypothetical protein|nr:RsiV family protein [Truepera sp.]HRQ10846.1 RsiV family protein [Trueperaceae bacterium]
MIERAHNLLPWSVRHVVALLVAALLGVAAAADAAPWRALYAGALATDNVVVDLTLIDATSAHARVLLAKEGVMLTGSGTVKDADSIEIDLHPDVPTSTPSFALLYLINGAGDEEAVPATGHLSARLNPSWQDDGANLTMTLTLNGHSQATTLPRVAQYAYLRLTEGRLDAGAAWPRFGSRALQVVGNAFEAEANGNVGTFISEGREGVDEDNLGWGWTNDAYVDLAGAAGDYVSFLLSTTNYTGGAHPNSYYGSRLYELQPGGARLLDLGDLFSKNVDWVEPVTDLITADLAKQGAAWIEDGSVSVTPEDLSTFALGPTGITFVFDPYAMGPYVQGAFLVTLPYSEVADLAPSDGPIAAFMNGLQPEAFR